MQPQKPAEGIMLGKDFGNSKFYTVACSCGSIDHATDFEVEANEFFEVSVNTYFKQYSQYAHVYYHDCYFENTKHPFLLQVEYGIRQMLAELKLKLKVTANIWFKGYVEYNQCFLMTEQQALNYAQVLQDAVADVKEFNKSKN
jgi:hypothetical protein